MKKYKLLKDLPGIKAGAESITIKSSIAGELVIFKGVVYEHTVSVNDTDWIEEVRQLPKEFTRDDVINIVQRFSNFDMYRAYKGGKNLGTWIRCIINKIPLNTSDMEASIINSVGIEKDRISGIDASIDEQEGYAKQNKEMEEAQARAYGGHNIYDIKDDLQNFIVKD